MTARRSLEWSEGAAGPVLTALVSDKPYDWRDLAACARLPGDSWFPEKGGSNRTAKRICAGCPVRAQCLDFALATSMDYGIWGGLSERERRRMSGPRPHVPRQVPVKQKFCPACRETKGSDEFWRNRGKPDGLDTACSACRISREPRRHGKAAA